MASRTIRTCDICGEDGAYTFGDDEHWQEFPAVKKGN